MRILRIYFLLMCVGILMLLNDAIKFLGDDIEEFEYFRRKEKVENFTSKGRWVNSWESIPHFRPLYTAPCHEVDIYKYGSCNENPAHHGVFYSWKPDAPLYHHQFEPEHMCRMMQGRNILIVGDSLSEEFMTTFVSGMLAHPVPSSGSDDSSAKTVTQDDVDEYYAHCKSYPCQLRHALCDITYPMKCGRDMPSFNVSLYTSYTLANDTTSAGLVRFWVNEIGARNASLVIVNTGAHPTSHNVSYDNLISGLKLAKERFPQVSFIFRNTVHGHHGCEHSLGSLPLSEAPSLNGSSHSFKWHLIEGQNNMLRRGMLREGLADVVYLDVFSSGILRADSHPGFRSKHDTVPDCLHYCQPGPIDSWVQLFYETMIIMTGKEPAPFKGFVSDTMVPRRFQGSFKSHDIVKHPKSHWMYFLDNGTKHAIHSYNEFVRVAEEGFEFSDVKTLSEEDVLDYKTGRPIALRHNKRIWFEY